MSAETESQARAEACAKAMWSDDRASQGLGMRIDRVAPGAATVSMPVRADMTNGHGICHGGFIFALADSAFAFACNSHGPRVVAQHCAITFLKPGMGGQRLIAYAVERARGGRSGIYDITVKNDQGEVIAEFRGNSRMIAGSWVEAAHD
jgi:acyl-CoA thioesterase